MDALMISLSASALQLRYIGYPVLLICGLGLGLIAFGRTRRLCNGRRRQYRTLTSMSLSLAWIGGAGWSGLIGYNGGPIPKPLVSLAFSMGIVWLAGSLLVMTILVMYEEMHHEKANPSPAGYTRQT